MARVLVIDDEDVIGAVLRYAFLEQGHETLVADGGRQGIERARAEHAELRSRISVPSLAEVADRYLDAMGLR